MNRTESRSEFTSRVSRRVALTMLGIGLVVSFAAPASGGDHGLPTARAEEVGMSSERLQRLTQRMQEYVDKGQVAGVVTLVARQGKVVHYQAQGYRNREEKIPMKEDDLFVIMSMTKPIASTALMMLFEEGRFLLNDPVSKWLPEFDKMQVKAADGKLTPARPITVRHVLTHTAGLGNPRGATLPQTSLRDKVRQIATYPLNFQPGDKWEYGSATDVVAALVEVMSGMNMDDFLRARVFKPLGMNDTHYNVPESKWERRASVYVPEKDGSIKPRAMTRPRPTTVFGGVAGLTSTAADYFRFHQMMLNGGTSIPSPPSQAGDKGGVRLLSPKTVDLMISNHIGDLLTMRGSGASFGLGYSILMDPGKSSESLTPGTFGWGGAWGTYFFVDPVEEMIGIIMIQITAYTHLRIRQDLGTLATQAIVEAKSSGGQKIRGYWPLH